MIPGCRTPSILGRLRKVLPQTVDQMQTDYIGCKTRQKSKIQDSVRENENKSIFRLGGLTLLATGWSKMLGGRHRKLFSKRISLLIALAGLLFAIQHTTQLIIVSSPSLPGKIYLLVKSMPWKKGDVVSFQGHPSPYLQGTPLLTKRIAGIEGDRVFYKQGVLQIERGKIGHLLSYNSRGQSLNALPSGRIPKGFVFMAGEDPRSFDSRYQEFGLVQAEHIMGRSFRLW